LDLSGRPIAVCDLNPHHLEILVSSRSLSHISSQDLSL
jgi:hypothetical protein